jgi:hypothetical protein
MNQVKHAGQRLFRGLGRAGVVYVSLGSLLVPAND